MESQNIFCSNCGDINKASSNFCTNCGQKLVKLDPQDLPNTFSQADYESYKNIPSTRRKVTPKKDLQSPDSGFKPGCFGFIVIIVVIFIIAQYCNERDLSPAEKQTKKIERDIESNKHLALSYSRDYVKDALKAPATAKFPGILEAYDHVRHVGGDKYVISSYVDSENSFGALIRTNYICEIEIKGDEIYLHDLRLLE